MAWYRAASVAVLIHLVVLFIFSFTFKGSVAMYKIDLVFLGSILRPQEVSSQGVFFPSGRTDLKDVDVLSGQRTPLLWSRGISIDKPDFFRNIIFPVHEDDMRFAGKRVDMEQQDPDPSHSDNDLPQPAPVKMRMEQP